jgi:hypothetical protein
LRRPPLVGIVAVTPIGETETPGVNASVVPPIRTTSPTFKSAGPVIRASLTYVPPVLPASSNVATPLITEIRA